MTATTFAEGRSDSGIWDLPCGVQSCRVSPRRPAGSGARHGLATGEMMATHKAGSGRPVGIRDVARIAGVSVATASLALNGRPGVADETRRRAVAAAKQLGYRANPQAQALRRGRTTTYGFVVRNFANPFFLEVLSGAQQVAAESGATLLVLDSRYSIDRERRHRRGGTLPRPASPGRSDAPTLSSGRVTGRGYHEEAPQCRYLAST